MRLPRLATCTLLFPATLALLAGCSRAPSQTSPQNEQSRSELGDVWEMYDGYVLQHHKPPAQLSDFKGLQVPYPRGHAAMTSGRLVVRFGTPLEPGGTVLAYEKDAPQKGGMVLLNDGTIKSMPADEVQAAIK